MIYQRNESFFLTAWSYPSNTWGNYPTCDDNSDKVMNSTKSLDKPCNGSNYFYQGHTFEAPTDWTWFHCRNNDKCIHIDSRCDMHPNYECIYDRDGIMVAEDEEECFDEYKRKGLIGKTANVICSSQDHNIESPAVILDIYYESFYKKTIYNVTVIPRGTTVQILGVRCDGISNCWNGIDEDFCGFTSFETVGIGKQFKHIEALKGLLCKIIVFRHKLSLKSKIPGKVLLKIVR